MSLMSYQCFGKILLSSRDLDPIYVMLHDANMDRDMLKRWLLAYWCYYSAGVSSHIAEADDFWAELWRAHNEKWPRGAERRHFRGETSYKALLCLQSTDATPEQIVDYMTGADNFQDISRRVQQFDGFGPWIAWKVADMAERVLHLEVDFSNANLGIYKDPVHGAALVLTGDENYPINPDELQGVVDDVVYVMRDFASPPWYDRSVNIQEAETVLCKYKSYCHGHYPPGKDTKEVYHGMKGWGKLSSRLRRHLPKHPLTWRDLHG